MGDYILEFEEIDLRQVAVVGGKGAHLGELSRIEGVHVPPGFCVTTEAFDTDPKELAAEIEAEVARLGREAAYAVRSSATAEDSPAASFAGLHDTYLNVVGTEAILEHVRRCWASLFNERAVAYRRRNGMDDSNVRMAVVVQRMVFPRVAGVLFTADPISGHRKVAAVEAVAGLGEALVSGTTNADLYKVREGRVIDRSIVTTPLLTDAEVVRLTELGRKIEAHFGRPQDIEWCLADDEFSIVQSRPITTLFPIPDAGDGANHVYLSVGHQQMMTDPMKPLGISFWQMTTPRPMAVAGGRLFVDVTQMLASPASRAGLLEMMRKADPLFLDAMQTVIDRDDFLPPMSGEGASAPPPPAAPEPIETDPAIVEELIASTQASIAALKRDIAAKSGSELLDFIATDLQELRRILFDRRSHQVFMSAMEATWWLNEKLEEWLGEKQAADTLTLSVPHNITSEMGLALLDVADVIRPHPDVVAYLEQVEDDDSFLDELPKLAGGGEARDAIRAWLDTYGMRGVGEIDITRPRWSERPRTLLPLLLGNIRNFAPGAAKRQFAQGLQKALQKEQELLARLRALPDGEQKADETKWRIDRVRTFIGYREYPKYGKVSRTFLYKQALLAEAGRLVQAGVLREREDIFYLTFDELRDVVRTQRVDDALLRARKEAFASYRALTPPRVLTSDGEAIQGTYRRSDVPAGALTGLPVSSGVAEGRARVILDVADAKLEPGDILVTTYTDPSWTPLFVAIKALVTEVGGLMTHGAVIAREYGLPAVVGVADATRRICDGQRIRVDGTEGYVEIVE